MATSSSSKVTKTRYLYLISDGDEFCKVGVAKDIKNRMSSIQTGNPKKLILIKYWKFSSYNEAYLIEQLTLQGSINSAAIGEWISTKPNILVRLIDFLCNHIKNKKYIKCNHGCAWKLIMDHNKKVRTNG